MGLTLVFDGVVNVDILIITFYSDDRSVFWLSQRCAFPRDGFRDMRTDSQCRQKSFFMNEA